MSGRVVLLWYHARLGISWAGLVPPLALAGAVAVLSLTGASNGQRSHDLAVLLEVVLPLLAALLAAPLLMAERERNTLSWLATRTPLLGVVVVRLALLAPYLRLAPEAPAAAPPPPSSPRPAPPRPRSVERP